MKINPRLKVRREAFTLIELITVVSVIVILFALVVGGFTYADRSSKRSRTDVVIRATRSALESYKEKFGSYPKVANPDSSITVADKSYVVGGGACLYQAMSGDGYDYIDIGGANLQSSPTSDGNVDEIEAKNVTLNDMPREMWTKTDNVYYMVDGFGHPIRYIKAAPTTAAIPGQAAPDPITINRGSYDIWSYGEDADNILSSSLDAANGGGASRIDVKWIKNW
ncbi:MAG: type II secretion system protein [Verrucomicrobiota bacterium]